jgi:hypothetical protein
MYVLLEQILEEKYQKPLDGVRLSLNDVPILQTTVYKEEL